MEIKVECERQAGAWNVRVPDLDNLLIRSKRLDTVSDQVKDLVESSGAAERCDIVVRVEAKDPGLLCDWESAREKMSLAMKLQEEASMESRTVIQRLRNQGLTIRDIAVLLQLSPQRVSQLASIQEANA